MAYSGYVTVRCPHRSKQGTELLLSASSVCCMAHFLAHVLSSDCLPSYSGEIQPGLIQVFLTVPTSVSWTPQDPSLVYTSRVWTPITTFRPFNFPLSSHLLYFPQNNSLTTYSLILKTKQNENFYYPNQSCSFISVWNDKSWFALRVYSHPGLP